MKTIDKDGTINYDDTGRQYFPAMINVRGTAMWRRNGENHREDGPAIFPTRGKAAWYFDPSAPCDHPGGRTRERMERTLELFRRPSNTVGFR
jgi:hypothetical protein